MSVRMSDSNSRYEERLEEAEESARKARLLIDNITGLMDDYDNGMYDDLDEFTCDLRGVLDRGLA